MTDDVASDAQPTPLRFLTVQQVADELVTKQSTIRGLIQSGELPAIQIGGRGAWRVERTKFEEYIAAAYDRVRADIANGKM